MNPNPVMHSGVLDLLTAGNLEDDLGRLAEVDLVIESVVERLDVKESLWRRVGDVVRPGTLLGSGTSGISCTIIARSLPPEHRPYFLGVHFFNPPRYLNLLELIPTSDTDPQTLALMSDFGERTLGKTIVVSNDTPNFIANRIGTFSLMTTLHAMDELGLSIDAIDAITGPAMGRPRSATFRTLDLVGVDTMAHVARNTEQTTSDPAETAIMQLPPYVEQMLERGMLGEKAGKGFYQRIRREGGSIIFSLDLETMEYGERETVEYESLDMATRIDDPAERIRILVNADDEAGKLAWSTLSKTLAFTADKTNEIANGDINAIDRAMRAGFNWELGPFEIWNALGVQQTISRMEADGITVPDWVRDIDAFAVHRDRESPLNFAVLKKDSNRIVKQSSSITLVDLDDEVLGLEIHTPKQAIDEDYIKQARRTADEVRANWRGLVVSASDVNFCVGANLMMVLGAASEGRWDEIDALVQAFQDVNMLFKYLERPVVVAPHGMTLGGGAEIAMHCARTVAAAESYIGLVEVGVGLIPAGGGVKEMAFRASLHVPTAPSQMPNRPELISFITRPFENIGTAAVSGSAAEACDLGYLRPTDQIVMNRNHILNEAKLAVLELDRRGYQKPVPAEIPIAGPDGRAVLDLVAYSFKNWGMASEHDYQIVRKLAYVLTGGDLPAGTRVPEQYLLDLEREAFVSLCGMEKSRERMEHMLATGRPLRN